MIDRLRDFILALGYGFCFIGRQHRVTLGRNEYFIDLLFYHRFPKALVAVELKVGKFEPEYAGKMDFYLNLLNEKERAPDDAPSIGIILCAEKVDSATRSATKHFFSHPIQLGFHCPPGRHVPVEGPVELRAVVVMQQVTELMQQHVVDAFARRLHQPRIQRDPASR